MLSRRVPALAALLALGATASFPAAAAEDRSEEASSVSTATGVVVHGVDTRTLLARFREVDRKIQAGEPENAAADLAEILAGNLDALVEESQGVYLRAEEAALLRVAALPPAGLAAWRKLADPGAEGLLSAAAGTDREALDRGALDRGASRAALSTHGPRLAVLLADRKLARGDLRGAARVLEDLLVLWRAATLDASGDAAELPGVPRAAVVSRLAAVSAALADPGTVRSLLEREPVAVLDGPSPALPGATLREELSRAARRAAATHGRAKAPRGPLTAVADLQFRRDDTLRGVFARGREITGRATPVETPAGPLLLARVQDPLGIRAQLVALAPPESPSPHDAGALRDGKLPPLRRLWSWPSSEELQRWPRVAGDAPLEPVVHGDLVLFCWPSTRTVRSDGERHALADESEAQDLIALSLSAEGRVVDERGVDEEDREDPELGRLSFCGNPIVVDGSVYVTLVGRSQNGGATELHMARFDPVEVGSQVRLTERWRRHLLDGTPVPPAAYVGNARSHVERPLAWPTGLAERSGRIYVGSNTGAVACVEASSGEVVWLETYDRLGPSNRQTVLEAEPIAFKYGPVLVDGPRVYVAPRDAEMLLVYSAAPLPSRSVRVDQLTVRGAGTARVPGSPLGDLIAEEVVGVLDGVVYLSGHLPQRSSGAVRWPPSPIVGYRMRPRRDGESASRLQVPEIPELTSSGSPSLAADSIVFPTYKALYRLPLADFQSPPAELWRADLGLARSRAADRIGNVFAAGDLLWCVTPSRVVLFRAR